METLIRNANRGSVSTGYEIEYSCLFDSASSHNMYFYPDSTSSTPERRKGTISFWVKRSTITHSQNMRIFHFGENTDGYDSRLEIEFKTDDTMFFYPILRMTTAMKFRDPTAWYHIVWFFDCTQPEQDDDSSSDTNHAQDPSTNPEGGSGTAQCGLWVNGVRLGNDNGLPHGNTYGRTQNSQSGWGRDTSDKHAIGYDYLDDTGAFNGYLAEFHAVQGQVLDAEDFGEFNSNGIWIPKEVDLDDTDYRENGFYLKFDDSADMGNDSSGEGNDFTLVNMDSTNQCTDTPTNNFCTMNPLSAHSSLTLTEGNLKASYAGGNDTRAFGTMAASSGKWYWEIKGLSPNVDSVQKWAAGVAEEDNHQAYNDKSAGDGPYEVGLYTGNGKVYTNESVVDTFGEVTFAQNDIMMLAMDVDNLKMYWGKNGTWLNSGDPTSGATGTGAMSLTASWSPFIPIFAEGNSNSQIWQVNFGNPSFSISSGNADGDGYGNFEYAVPSGFYAWCTKNLAQYG